MPQIVEVQIINAEQFARTGKRSTNCVYRVGEYLFR
jgi:hypothetical protein